MSYSPYVKEIAGLIDPACWESYSGESPEYKRRMEERRIASLKKAEELEREIVKDQTQADKLEWSHCPYCGHSL